MASLPLAPIPAPPPTIGAPNPAATLSPIPQPGAVPADAVVPPVSTSPTHPLSLDAAAPIAPRSSLGTGAAASRPLPPADPVSSQAPDLARPDIPPRPEVLTLARLPDTAQMPAPHAPHTLAASAAAQIARAAQEDLGRATGAPIDIALDPPELGRVRLSMVEVNGILSLSISVERPETADLMRRHLVLLADEFLRAGVDAPSVQISHQGGQGAGGGHTPAAQPPGLPPTGADADDPTAAMPARRPLSHGLDLRL
ncbi:MAG: flagellar hook-length control protein FliK [Roseicyclus sp.]|uniref:flagellar hook-length control protein FliK n=1 Tax=Roseicyclus sp. TaxID=1914329 RepID=UPI003A897809